MSSIGTREHASSLPREETTSLHDLSLAGFAAALASVEPSPGGSAAVSVPAALAAGLVAMVARLTVACAPFSDVAFEMDAVGREADELRAQLLDLPDADAGAFQHVITARRLSRGTPEQQHLRRREVQRAYEEAVEPPLHVCRLSLRVLELAAQVAERGHPHAAADTEVAELFAAASIEAASQAAEIYLIPVENESFRSACREELQSLRESARSAAGYGLGGVA